MNFTQFPHIDFEALRNELKPETPAQFGSMNAQQMIEHVSLIYDYVLSDMVTKVLTPEEKIEKTKKLFLWSPGGFKQGVTNEFTQSLSFETKYANMEEAINEFEKRHYLVADALANNLVVKAIHVPYTGIIDYSQVCEKLAEKIAELGAEIFLGHLVEKIENHTNFVVINTSQKEFEATQYINCAGLYSDKIAALTNKDIDTRIIPFRGEYYMLKPEKRALIKNLIYPVPDPNFPFLGVHFTRMIDGGVEAGPNAVFAFKREGYHKTDFDFNETMESLAWPGFRKVAVKYWKTGLGEFYRSFSKTAFTNALQKLVPSIQEDDLVPAEAGVRAQACDKFGGLLDDFKIIEEPNAIHILNAPSPAATSSLSIGKTIAEMALTRL